MAGKRGRTIGPIKVEMEKITRATVRQEPRVNFLLLAVLISSYNHILYHTHSMSTRPKNTIYIGGIPSQSNESTIHTYFEPFGEIMEVQIPKSNQQTGGGHRGFGFVMFANDQEAESAIDNMHLNEIEGVRQMRSSIAVTCNVADPETFTAHRYRQSSKTAQECHWRQSKANLAKRGEFCFFQKRERYHDSKEVANIHRNGYKSMAVERVKQQM